MANADDSEMVKLRELVASLVGRSDDVRKAFHNEPIEVLEDRRLDPASREVAILFTMNRGRIGSATGLQRQIAEYVMESDWDEQGPDWKDPGGTTTDLPGGLKLQSVTSSNFVIDPDAEEVRVDDPLTRGGWGDPSPHGRGFRPARHKAGPGTVKLVIVGEGLLPSARVHVEKRNDPNLNATVGIGRAADANFRRMYIETEPIDVSSWPAGLYRVKIFNHSDMSLGYIRAGHYFEIV